MPDKEERIRARAHKLWEDEGRPEGSHERHWAEAERHVDAELGAAKKPARKPAAPKKAAAAPEVKSAPATAPAKAKATAAPKRTVKAKA